MNFQQIHNFSDLPDVVGDSGFHRRGYSQALVNPAKVVVHEVEGDGVLEVLDLLGETV